MTEINSLQSRRLQVVGAYSIKFWTVISFAESVHVFPSLSKILSF
jgi:hypothetical protein